MALSRTALIALPLLLAAASAQAQPDSAERAIDAQRSDVRAAVAFGCGPEGADDEIIVCGRREEGSDRRYRLPPIANSPIDSGRAGSAQLHALALGTSPCTTVGPVQRCGGGLDVLGIGFAIVRGIRAIRARRD